MYEVKSHFCWGAYNAWGNFYYATHLKDVPLKEKQIIMLFPDNFTSGEKEIFYLYPFKYTGQWGTKDNYSQKSECLIFENKSYNEAIELGKSYLDRFSELNSVLIKLCERLKFLVITRIKE